MKRPYVSSFEDYAGTQNETPEARILRLGAAMQNQTTEQRLRGAPSLENALKPRSPLIRQKTKAKPRARTSAEWYVVQAFADCLSRERERRGWGMTALAAHIGMSVSQYRKMENGHLGSTIRLANKVCRRLGITFSLGEWPE
jgi:ribosome-binding protein aMBF1 (putative translation factor)